MSAAADLVITAYGTAMGDRSVSRDRRLGVTWGESVYEAQAIKHGVTWLARAVRSSGPAPAPGAAASARPCEVDLRRVCCAIGPGMSSSGVAWGESVNEAQAIKHGAASQARAVRSPGPGPGAGIPA
ncbi:hypothetical protein [Sinosporangium siamense]|nr:hypothetical protein [Sinosporangium siamense]